MYSFNSGCRNGGITEKELFPERHYVLLIVLSIQVLDFEFLYFEFVSDPSIALRTGFVLRISDFSVNMPRQIEAKLCWSVVCEGPGVQGFKDLGTRLPKSLKTSEV